MPPLSEEQSAELERRLQHADTIQAEMRRMSEDEIKRVRDPAGYVVQELFTDDYLVRWRTLTEQLRTEREEIADYVRSHR